MKPLPATDTAVGIDVGLDHLLTLSTDEKVANPRSGLRDRTRLALAQRRLAKKAKGDGANRAKARRKVAKIYAWITDRRRDGLHKLTTRLVRENQTDATHSLVDDGLERSAWRLTLSGVFAPRQLYTDRFLADQARFVQQ